MKRYICSGSPGTTEIPFDSFSFIVSDEFVDGQYLGIGGVAETIDGALNAACAAMHSTAITELSYCYNDANDQEFIEIMKPFILRNFNVKPFATVHATNGTDQSVATFGNVSIETSYTYRTNGLSAIMNGTPFGTNMLRGNVGEPNIRITINAFPSECVTDGHFSFDTDQTYISTLLTIQRTGNYEWSWNIGGITVYLNVPAEWLVFNGTSVDEGSSDPYDDDTGDSDEGGGDEDQDNWEDGDSNPEPDLPGVEATDAGFITLYQPTIAQLRSLANYMWSNLFDVDTFKKLFADPMDCILGLSLVPVNNSGAASAVNIGNINTGITLNKASSQYKRFNCGEIKISERLHSYLDYSPYRKAYLFLPYIGMQELDIDMLNGQTLKVTYHVDILTGGCIAYVIINNNVIDTYSGQCSMNVPITSRDWSNTIASVCTLAASAAGGFATGGLSAPVSAASIAGLAQPAAQAAGNVMNSKPSHKMSGGIGGAPGILGCQKPFLILERPRLCKPSKQNHYLGYPGFITQSLGSLSGFTQVQNARLSGVKATEAEREEIMQLLRSGVYL